MNDDVFILDRGFCDAFDDLRAMNYHTYMPATKKMLAWQSWQRNKLIKLEE